VKGASSKAEKFLPGLSQKLKELRTMADGVLEACPLYNEGDHFAFMALCFLVKQIEHANSILVLVKAGLCRDALLITRSMVEGLAQLLYAARDPSNRALRWRAFVVVGDWRTMKTKVALGEAVDPKKRASVEEGVKKFGQMFLTKKARRRVGSQQHSGDPYSKSWSGRSYSEMIEEIGRGDIRMRKLLYEPLSAWHHWSPEGVGQAIRRDGDMVEFAAPTPEDAWTALATGFQCLFQTAAVLDSHLQLGLQSRLSDLRARYLEFAQRGTP